MTLFYVCLSMLAMESDANSIESTMASYSMINGHYREVDICSAFL